ncbi:hypothetical protein nbrc107696_22220 [Gordonia spumicola]|uniref:Uncharacterized protein n=1 Tax=Gordonia spumicola TaxID=589161 RepID=A0A7I9V8R2_9ACTN|nr:hypothetical protein nbrc107696_22220 [Gordonia spumicola]
MFSVEFETTPEFVRSVLPPDLEPVGSSGIASVAQWQCGLSGEFESAAVMLNVRWREFVGSYYLTLFISGDMPVTIGRDLWCDRRRRVNAASTGTRTTCTGTAHETAFGASRSRRVSERNSAPRAVVSNSIEVGLPLTHNAGAAGDPWTLDRPESNVNWVHTARAKANSY